ncbi:MAG TPA: metal-dependent hydrolase [Pyrinomonadaceae bacterium]|nr:metal-dependent hydrolase [Pyrinomonadaceae bacterium]
MDNLTHSLVGLAAAKAGLEKLSPGATTLCVLAANAPDIDVGVLVFAGRWPFLHYHRGITHSIVGVAVLAVALPVIFCLTDRIAARIRKRDAQFRFSGLLVASLVTTATHPILDWTNNYGMRFLLPWNSKWTYGDFAFVIDPYIWLLLGGATFVVSTKTPAKRILWLVLGIIATFLVTIGSAIQSPSANFWGMRVVWVVGIFAVVWIYLRWPEFRNPRQVARGAAVVAVLYLLALAGLHAVALREARAVATEIARVNSEQQVDVAAMAALGNPFKWDCVTETNLATYKFNISLLSNGTNEARSMRFEKPSGRVAAAVAEAERDSRAQVLLEFMRFPGFRVVGSDCATQTLVQFADLRYTEPGKRNGSFSLEVPIECPFSSQEK